MRLLFFVSGFSCFVLFFACTADELPMPMVADCEGSVPTYEVEIRPIIEESCAYSGCHLDSAPGNYTSYDGMLANLESGRFREKVIGLRSDDNLGMPPNFAPAGRPKDLSDAELLLIECWLDAGYPE